MIEVPINNIIPIEDALGDIEKIINSAGEKDNLYVLTKSGKPYAAIVNIDYLEHLPEMENAGQTKPIHEIGKEQNNARDSESGGIKIEEPETREMLEEHEPTEPPMKQPSEDKKQEATTEQTQKNTEGEAKEVYDENIGPWKKQKNEQPPAEDKMNEPPDLPLD